MYRRATARNLWIGFGALTVILLSSLQESVAQQPRPYCFQGGRGSTGGLLDCSFYTLQQCLATASGLGGGCQVNPAIGWNAIERARAQGAVPRAKQRRKQQ